MSHAALETAINTAWESRDGITPATKGEARDAVEATLAALDTGSLRVAEKRGADWHVNQWAKKAVLLGFRLKDMEFQSGGPQGGGWWDKVDSKFHGWAEADWRNAGFRAVPNCIVRRSAFIAKGVVLMPSFVNLGAYVDEGTMVDTWATVGSCAQIGKNVHLSGGVGIGGVLEPMQAGPTIIEDNCFIGARSEVVEGCIVREGSVLGMGVFIGKSTKIVDRATGNVTYGEVPAGSVVVAGSMPSTNGINLYCAVIVKQVDAQTRSKTSINEPFAGLIHAQRHWLFRLTVTLAILAGVAGAVVLFLPLRVTIDAVATQPTTPLPEAFRVALRYHLSLMLRPRV